MAVNVVIQPQGLFRKKAELKDIVADDMSFGVMDEHYRLIPDAQGDVQKGECTVVYDQRHIARGVDVSFENGAVCFRMPLPNSLQEITWFYKVLIPRTCKLMGTKQFERDEEAADIRQTAQIEEMIAQDVKASEGALLHMAQNIQEGEIQNLMIFGVMHPIYIGEQELALIDYDMKKLGDFLHEKQQLDAFYPAPKLYQNGERIFGCYVISADVLSIVPLKPSVPFANKDIQVDDWYAFLATPDNEAKPVPYMDFIETILNRGACNYYDAAHVTVSLPEAELSALRERYQTEI